MYLHSQMTLLNVFVVTLICLVGSIQGDNSTKTKIDVYYETLCPDSIRFLLHQLIPNYPIIKSKVNLHLHPFGKAEIYEFGKSFNFYCQHGPKECHGNMIHACVIEDSGRDFEKSFPFIKCMEQDLYGRRRPNISDVAKKCAETTLLDWKVIDDCATGPRGMQLHLEAGRRTKSVKPKITFVPTIVINDKYSESVQNQALYGNFTQLVLSINSN